MEAWLEAKTPDFAEPKGEPSYLGQGNRPFPLNPAFISEPVLSEQAREMIWRDVIQNGKAIKATSAKYGVDIRRVAAVVRMKEIEKTWEKEVSELWFSLPLKSFCNLASHYDFNQKIRLVLKTPTWL